MTEETIPGIVLAPLLRIEYRTLRYKWRRILPPIDPEAAHPRYYVSVVDKWLAESAAWFEHPPTLADLCAGRLVLLTPDEMTRLSSDWGRRQLNHDNARDRYKLPYLRLTLRCIRYSLAGAKTHIARPVSLAIEEVCHVFGVGRKTVKEDLIDTGRLEAFNYKVNGHYRVLVTYSSVVACVQGLLPKSADAESWVEDRLASPDPPMSSSEAADYLNTSINTVLDLARTGKLRFIFSPSRSERLFMVDSLLAYIEASPLSSSAVGGYFGASARAASQWPREKLVCKHTHAIPGLYAACMVDAVAPYVSPGINPKVWCRARERPSAVPLIAASIAAKRLGVSIKKLTLLAESGEVGGIRTPNGQWHFTPWAIKNYRCVSLRARSQS